MRRMGGRGKVSLELSKDRHFDKALQKTKSTRTGRGCWEARRSEYEGGGKAEKQKRGALPGLRKGKHDNHQRN